MATKAENILRRNQVFIPNEVIAEVVYVLEKVYQVSRREICEVLRRLFDYDSVLLQDYVVLIRALETYALNNIDFVDAILYAYKAIRNYTVVTFDKKLTKLLESVEEDR